MARNTLTTPEVFFLFLSTDRSVGLSPLPSGAGGHSVCRQVSLFRSVLLPSLPPQGVHTSLAVGFHCRGGTSVCGTIQTYHYFYIYAKNKTKRIIPKIYHSEVLQFYVLSCLRKSDIWPQKTCTPGIFRNINNSILFVKT